jgi:hypothetical protein
VIKIILLFRVPSRSNGLFIQRPTMKLTIKSCTFATRNQIRSNRKLVREREEVGLERVKKTPETWRRQSSTDSESVDLTKRAKISPPRRITKCDMTDEGLGKAVERGVGGGTPKRNGQDENVPITAMSSSSDEAWLEIEISKKTAVSTLNGVLKSSSSASSEDSGEQRRANSA